MEPRSKERSDELPTVATPEDVAILYSWANLHGAKYRDFSASRREYRAQLRHRAAEQAREQELRAQANAETAASIAERAARQAEEVVMSSKAQESKSSRETALREAEETARVAAAERIEAARRAEAAALAVATARRAEREVAEANASARRQAAQYADSDVRRRRTEYAELEAEVPGEISDPYTPQIQAQPRQLAPVPQSSPSEMQSDLRFTRSASNSEPSATPVTVDNANSYTAPQAVEYAQSPQQPSSAPPQSPTQAPRRPQGYRPNDASGVRQIYRGPESEELRENTRSQATRQLNPVQEGARPASQPFYETARSVEERTSSPDIHAGRKEAPWELPKKSPAPKVDRASAWADHIAAPSHNAQPSNISLHRGADAGTSLASPARASDRDLLRSGYASVEPVSEQTPREGVIDPTPRRRRQDAPGYKEEHPSESNPSRRKDDLAAYGISSRPTPPSRSKSTGEVPPSQPASRPVTPADPSGPAWLYASTPQSSTNPVPASAPIQPSVADTLQHSRERVAARWYALKGVFDQPGQEHPEPAPVRQKEVRTPILAIFSMAGGVGKTSLVATLGRSLSSLGEKVLLTDTTSHGLLPFYFGASELRQGTVRTFSPPSGSTDAPIYLVSYDVEQKASDETAQDALIDEITASSRGTHRVLLDLSVSSGWIVRRMARLSPTILVPVAPDMNSVISLQAVERFFNGVADADGRPLNLFYLLNQFDASLPLHLDVREVLRRQLGERLLPFVIRRAPAVSEALAEGMTIVDYSPDAPVAEDYLDTAHWLRTVAAPATAGFRNVRWSER